MVYHYQVIILPHLTHTNMAWHPSTVVNCIPFLTGIITRPRQEVYGTSLMYGWETYSDGYT